LVVFLIYFYICTSFSSPIPPYILPNSLFTFSPPTLVFSCLVLFASTFLFVLAVRPNSLFLSALSFTSVSVQFL
jgi:hypothetical protein